MTHQTCLALVTLLVAGISTSQALANGSVGTLVSRGNVVVHDGAQEHILNGIDRVVRDGDLDRFQITLQPR